MDITVTDLKKRFDAGETLKVIDVREVHEFEMDHIQAENIPMHSLPAHMGEWEKDSEIILCCRSGGRSGSMTSFMRQNGFTKVRNLLGGMIAWKDQVDENFNV